MKFRVLPALLVLASAPLALASGPQPDAGEVGLSVGETVYFELDSSVVGKKVGARLLKEPIPGWTMLKATLTTNAAGSRTLSFRNDYAAPIQFSLRSCVQAPQPNCETSTLVIILKAGATESASVLQMPADRIVLLNFIQQPKSLPDISQIKPWADSLAR